MENIISKNFEKARMIVGILLLLLGTFPTLAVYADQSQDDVTQQIQSFQSQLNTQLSQVNQLYSKASEAQQQITTAQAKIGHLEGKIEQAEKDEASLKETVSAQMRALQSSGGVTVSVLSVITSSNSLSDMIQRLTNLNMVLAAESTQVKKLKNTQLSLKKMKSSLESSEIQLVKNKQSYQGKVTDLKANITTLQTKISSNKQLLTEMQSRAAADQAARQEKLTEQAAAIKAKQTSTSDDSTTTPTTPVVPDDSDTTGKTLEVLATAYSWQNVGYITATGIDLRTNPMCIAVDPSVIPLGSLLEVPGYGVAIAGDTGGAITGNHIDVHFPTVAQAVNWGAQHIQIRILSEG